MVHQAHWAQCQELDMSIAWKFACMYLGILDALKVVLKVVQGMEATVFKLFDVKQLSNRILDGCDRLEMIIVKRDLYR